MKLFSPRITDKCRILYFIIYLFYKRCLLSLSLGYCCGFSLNLIAKPIMLVDNQVIRLLFLSKRIAQKEIIFM